MCFISLLHTHTTYTYTHTQWVFPLPWFSGTQPFGMEDIASVEQWPNLSKPEPCEGQTHLECGTNGERKKKKHTKKKKKKKKIFRLAFASNKILNTWQTCRYRHENNSSRSYSGECLNAAFAKGFFTLTPRWSVHSNTVRVTLPVSDWAADWLQSCYRIPFTG